MIPKCKQGQRAIVVGGRVENLGAIVHVVRAIGHVLKNQEFDYYGDTWVAFGECYTWIVESEGRLLVLNEREAYMQRPYADSDLCPLKDDPEIDWITSDEDLYAHT